MWVCLWAKQGPFFILYKEMLTKNQKSVLIDEASKKLSASKTAIFAEFNRIAVEDLKKLRRELKKAGADLKILKKRLLNLALKNAGVNFDSMTIKTQLGTIFTKGDLTSVAGLIYKFSKDLTRAKKGEFAVMAAYDLAEKRLVDANEFRAIATLPPREVLLAQIAMMLTMPLKQLMKVLEERSKKL